MNVYLFCRAKFDESDQRYASHYREDDDPSRYPKMIQSELYYAGKSRFGWGNEIPNPAEGVLNRIRPGDWIVHVNTPLDGSCTACRVLSCLKRDGGLQVDWEPGSDFQNYFEIDACSVVTFARDRRRLGEGLHRALCPRRKAQKMTPQVVTSFLEFLERRN